MPTMLDTFNRTLHRRTVALSELPKQRSLLRCQAQSAAWPNLALATIRAMNNLRPEPPPTTNSVSSPRSSKRPRGTSGSRSPETPSRTDGQLVGLTRAIFGTADSLPAGRWAGGGYPY